MSSQTKKEQTGLEVAVIGMAGRFPGAKNIQEFWDNLINGVETITFFSDSDLEEADVPKEMINNPNYIKAKGVLDDAEYFDANFFGYNPKDAQTLDPQARVFFECVWHALENAGYDPFSYPGLIGLYAGASANYFWEALSIGSDPTDLSGYFLQAQSMNTRISYSLNLKGPSVFLNTACSTSLTAIHFACRALLTGECNMALAGGVTLNLPQKSGYLYEEGSIVSPDGHCRAFDAQAKGTVWGEGAGVVVLKLLKKAVADGDHIYAVIKGTALNNDGSRRVGYTAPSIEGQADVIRTAQRVARVEPESISYIEAHGTGTNIGDPIEIEALKTAFHTEKKQFCRIGSVKTNIGHLDVAAGIAGFIKTVLALKYRQIPPSLHFTAPNPKIDFANSPFIVNNQLTDWGNGQLPLRAGVSSFGIGGTNAHVVLEEAPEQEKSQTKRSWHLIPVSAKTEKALAKTTDNLIEYLKKRPEADIADVAYTLSVGRAHFPYRRTVVCQNSAEAIEALTEDCPFSLVDDKRLNLVFTFPGQGSQYPNMGRELYETEPVFRETINLCSEILQPIIELDLKTLLYPDTETTPADSRIYETVYTQPIIFSFEYALAQLLTAWGIKPQIMIGHSIGEYVAACLAGVFSLEDALQLVAWRGKLMQEMAPGAMLSVSLSEAELRPMLGENLSLATVNSPTVCVVSGAIQAIDSLEAQLKLQNVNSIRLHVSHAFHSVMMEPILPQFLAKVNQIKLSPPKIPFISNVTGNWITASEATDPNYWVKHLRNTVRFADGIAKLLEKDRATFIEVGGGRTLTGLISLHPDFQPTKHFLFNPVRHFKENISDLNYLLKFIGRLWLRGVNLDWTAFYSSERRLRIPLPEYPFEKARFRINRDLNKLGKTARGNKESILKKKEIKEWFYLPSWEKTLPIKGGKTNALRYLIFSNNHPVVEGIIERLRTQQAELVIVQPGREFCQTEHDRYTINPENPMDYEVLIEELKSGNRFPQKIIHLWSIINEVSDSPEEFRPILDTGFYSLTNLAKAISKVILNNTLPIFVLSCNTQQVYGDEKIIPINATIIGACKVIQQEFPLITCRFIDLNLEDSEKHLNQTLDHLVNEFDNYTTESVIAYRNSQRWAEVFKPVSSEYFTDNNGDDFKNHPQILKEKGTYLITGGFGQIGMIIARYLAEKLQAKLILIGRSTLPDQTEWGKWLTGHEPQDKVKRQITFLRELETLGSEVLYFSSNLTTEKELEEIVCRAEKKFGKINGLIHSAGIIDQKLIRELTKTDSEHILQAKIYGLATLGKVFQDRELDFAILMSSLASVLGGLGFASYSAANLFMDAFVRKINANNRKQWLSVNWDAWRFDTAVDGLGTEVFNLDLTPEEGLKALNYILCFEDTEQLVISTGDLQARVDTWLKLELIKNQSEKEKPILYGRPELPNPYVPPRNEIESKLVQTWQEVLQIEKIGIDDNFFELGGHSLLAIKLQVEMEKNNLKFNQSDIYKYQTVRELAMAITEPSGELTPVLNETAASNQLKATVGSSRTNSEALIIDDIEPFNEIFYKNCFYNSFFPVVRHFQKNIITLLVNDVIVYKYDNTQNQLGLDVEYVSNQSISELMERMGIGVESKTKSLDIIQDIISSIALQRPVIINIDCFYASVREDMYQKTHWPHTWLIYGVDPSNEVCFIVEHRHKDNLSYEKQTVTFAELKDAYQGFLKNYQTENQLPSYYEFFTTEKLVETDETDQLVTTYRINNQKLHNAIVKGLNELENFCLDYRKLYQNEADLKKHLSQIINGINGIINAKQVQRYTYINIFEPASEMIMILDQILNNWKDLRIALARFMYSSVYSLEEMTASFAKVEAIIKLEKELIEALKKH